LQELSVSDIVFPATRRRRDSHQPLAEVIPRQASTSPGSGSAVEADEIGFDKNQNEETENAYTEPTGEDYYEDFCSHCLWRSRPRYHVIRRLCLGVLRRWKGRLRTGRERQPRAGALPGVIPVFEARATMPHRVLCSHTRLGLIPARLITFGPEPRTWLPPGSGNRKSMQPLVIQRRARVRRSDTSYRHPNVCTITGPAVAVSGPTSRGARLSSIHASTRLFDSSAPA
jgi:hypothetical protein